MLILGVWRVGVPAKPNHDHDDAALVRKTREGDVSAFETLVKRYQQPIYALCLRLTGTHQSADDVAQETFVKAYFSLSRFNDQLPFYPWIRRIAVNSALNLIKSRQRETLLDEARLESVAHSRSELSDSAGSRTRTSLSGSPLGSRSQSPEESLEKSRFEQKFQEALSSLPPDQRNVFVLKFYEGLSYGDIARLLHLPQGTVMSRLNRARQKLKSLLADSLSKENLG